MDDGDRRHAGLNVAHFDRCDHGPNWWGFHRDCVYVYITLKEKARSIGDQSKYLDLHLSLALKAILDADQDLQVVHTR